MAGAIIVGTSTASLHFINDGDKRYKAASYRRLWENTHQNGRFDALVPVPDGSEDHYVCKGVDGAQTFSTSEFEDRSSGRPGCYWHDSAKKLHIAGVHNTTIEFWTANYNSVTDKYEHGVGADGAGVPVPGMSRSTNSMTVSLTKSPNGHLWLFELDQTGLKMQRSTDDGATWEADRTVITTSNGHGSTDCCSINIGGTNYVCVFASEDDLVGSATQYFYLIDENNADITNASNWINESSSLPALDVGVAPDNHVCMARASNNKLLVTYKDGDNAIKMITRTAAGVWAGSFEVWSAASARTRPALLVKKISGTTDEEIMVITALTGDGPTILYKTSPVDTISFSSAAVLFEDSVGNDEFNEASVHQGDYVASSSAGVLVMAENVTDDTMWFNTLNITGVSGAIITGDTTVTFTSNATLTFNQNPAIIGNVTATLTPSAALKYNQHPGISGDVTATVSANAAMAFNQHPGIAGDVTTTIISDASMAFNQSRSILGGVVATVVSNASMAFNQHPAISGDVTTTVTANAVMAFNSGASITGDVTATITPAAAMQYNLHRSFTGDITATVTPAASMLFTSAVAPLLIKDGGETVIVREPKRKEKERSRFEVTLESLSENEQVKPPAVPRAEAKAPFNLAPIVKAFMEREYVPSPVEALPNPAIVVDMAEARDEMAASAEVKASEQAIKQALFEQRRTEAAAWHQRLLQEDEEILLIIAAS